MKITTTTSILAAFLPVLVAGCDLWEPSDSCDPTSPLYPELTPEQQAECESGTDDTDALDSMVANGSPEEAGKSPVVIDGDNELSARGWIANLNGDLYGDLAEDNLTMSIVDPEDCAALTKSWPVISGLGIKIGETRYCTLAGLPADAAYPPAATDANKLCSVPSDTWWKIGSWIVADHAPEQMVGDQWASELGCGSGNFKDVGGCELGIAAYDLGANSFAMAANHFHTDTCICAGSDDHCQPGAICEGAYVLDGLHVQPTICLPTDTDGNPAKPGGPEVYGLDSWEDGVELHGDSVVITAALMHGAWAWAGLWNDAQAFDDDGLITWCREDSLCAHLGLTEGDVVDADVIDFGRLVWGSEVEITVTHADGSDRTLTVTLDLG